MRVEGLGFRVRLRAQGSRPQRTGFQAFISGFRASLL